MNVAYKMTAEILSRGQRSKNTPFFISEQYPAEVMERRKILYPILKENGNTGLTARLMMDMLYIGGQAGPVTTPPRATTTRGRAHHRANAGTPGAPFLKFNIEEK